MIRLLGLALIAAAHAGASHAKEYNQSPHLQSETQATINRVFADIAGLDTGNSGSIGTFEDDCGDLNVGASDGSGEQVIVADQIINVAGNCRLVRRQGGFAPTPPPEGGRPDGFGIDGPE